MSIFFESHSSSKDNELGIASGILDSPLSERGILQAQDLGRRYQDKPLMAVYCSDLIRSYETARIAFKDTGRPIIVDPRLREWNYGRWNGSPAEDVEKKKKLHIRKPFEGGESLLGVLERTNAFLNSILERHYALPILIIGHRATYYALEHRVKKRILLELVTSPWSWEPGRTYDSNSCCTQV
jgi:broad specificity phosphatase PhoE